MSVYISDIYSNEIYNNLRPLYGNWEPSQPLALGDYGALQGRIFVRLGSISQLGIQSGVRKDGKKDQKYFTSKGSTEVKFNAAGSVPVGGAVNAKASLEVNFSSERAVFFNAAECEYSMMDDKAAVGAAIMKRYKRRTWKREWVVVTDVIQSGATTIAVSGGSSSNIVFEATGNVPNINLADASAGLTIKSAKNVGYQIVAAQGLVPLIGLSGVRPAFLWFGGDFRPLSLAMTNPAVLHAMTMSDEITTEASDKELFFGQLD